MSDIKIYQNQGGEIRWDGKQSALYDFELEPGGRVKGLEFLRDDDPRYARVANDRTIKLVDKMPSGDDIKELQDFIDRGNYKPEWIAGWMERLVAKAARVETERKAQEEAAARAEDIADRKAMRESLEKLGSLSNKDAGASVKGILKTLDPNVVAIINNRQMSTKQKVIELRSADKKFWGYANVDLGDLLGVSGQRISQILAEIDKDAKKVKKEAENRIDEKFVDDRRRPH